ncbi:cyclopropane-fatty-acyl-phospholipid synthase family protein [Tabrizicola sp.]|uniref:cyclopropane-fatty-acyl-phospholipid synthase family protein n=1 Tax=Tabrizicola sp. TaxID=2005166 RepID=UPI00286B1259|nr:cyclopropane-fatty-acyl-phospholipid synthase family protein [Tabrizicola sp.]
MWTRIFLEVLRRGIRTGHLTLTLPDGATHLIGPGDGPDVAITVHDPDFPRKFIFAPEVALGEAYVDGRITLAGDDIESFLTFAIRNGRGRKLPFPLGALGYLRKRTRSWTIWNHVGVSRRNVAHHYDLSGELYDLFLDETKQYTCAYFRRPEMTLEEAQAAKMAHIGAKLLIKPGMRVLDIGCGFGTLAIALARDHGAQVLGVTLSKVQLAEARRRAAAAGLSGQVEFRLQDYRAVPEVFDRVVSVGMMEHVGLPHLGTFFRRVSELMTPDGVALIHYIGRWSPPDVISPWFNKYIFPGAYCPTISEAMRVVEKTGMILSDLEVWRGHYERTLQEWLIRFDRNINRVRALYDERFIRMWRYYLQSAELSFSEAHLVIHQLQLAKGRTTVPGTRDYLYPATNA